MECGPNCTVQNSPHQALALAYFNNSWTNSRHYDVYDLFSLRAQIYM